jgi:hypothetical protein
MMNVPFARVERLVEGSPAAAAGLRVGDELVRFGAVNAATIWARGTSRGLATLDDLAATTSAAGGSIEIEVVRTTDGVGYERNRAALSMALRPGAWDDGDRGGIGFVLARIPPASDASSAGAPSDGGSGVVAWFGSFVGGVMGGGKSAVSDDAVSAPRAAWSAAEAEHQMRCTRVASIDSALSELGSVDEASRSAVTGGSAARERRQSNSDLQIEALAGVRDKVFAQSAAVRVAAAAAQRAAQASARAQTDVGDMLREQRHALTKELAAFYRIYNPTKASNGDCELLACKFVDKQGELWSALEEKYGVRPEPPTVAATVAAVADSVAAVPSFFNWSSSGGSGGGGGGVGANGDGGLGASDSSSSDDDASSDDEEAMAALWHARLKRSAIGDGERNSALDNALR